MQLHEPAWWYAPTSWQQHALSPFAGLWGWAAERRVRTTRPYRSPLPVICAGNFTAGGTGKTPLALLLAQMLMDRGERPAFLTRGYGGRVKGPHRVAPTIDSAADVGDEALLLARAAPTFLSADRARGAQAIASFAGLSPPTVIVMDDGLQNPGLAKDLTIAVVDGRRGLGNGEVIPAGPLRAPLAFQLGLADAILVNRPIGEPAGSSPVAQLLRQRFHGPVLEASVAPSGDLDWLRGKQVVALAGIGHPERFWRLLDALGADVVERIAYPDHHAFDERDAARVLARASDLQATIVTTEKDLVRLSGAKGAAADLRETAHAIPIRLQLDDRDVVRLGSLVDTALANRRRSPPQLSADAPSP